MTDNEIMALCAIRYTMGRRSYAVSDGQRWAREWGARSQRVRGVLILDLREAVTRADMGLHTLGDTHDEIGWREVLTELETMRNTEEGVF